MTGRGVHARFLLCGLSNRGMSNYALPLAGSCASASDRRLRSLASVVGVVEPDAPRVAHFNARFKAAERADLLQVDPDDFVDALDRLEIDGVIVASPDDSHAAYVIAALDQSRPVIVEKPMTRTAREATDVLEAERRSQSSVIVGHNFRYVGAHRRIKELIAAGAIGRPTHVMLDYHVDIHRGAIFFLRWHARRAASGGLSVTKSVHHLDLVSWWIDAKPTSVFAVGARNFYGADSPHRPRSVNGEPLLGKTLLAADPYFAAQIGSGAFPEQFRTPRVDLYGIPYKVQYPAGDDRYLYDSEIDVEDTYSALVSFDGGAHLAYTIDFSSTWEGFRAVLAGTHGQLEYVVGDTPDGKPVVGSGRITHRPLFGSPTTTRLRPVRGGHGGADPLMRQDLFRGPSAASRRLGLPANAHDGALAVATGEAIWRSIESAAPVKVADLVGGTSES